MLVLMYPIYAEVSLHVRGFMTVHDMVVQSNLSEYVATFLTLPTCTYFTFRAKWTRFDIQITVVFKPFKVRDAMLQSGVCLQALVGVADVTALVTLESEICCCHISSH